VSWLFLATRLSTLLEVVNLSERCASWRGERDKAFEWLERAYRQRDGGLVAVLPWVSR